MLEFLGLNNANVLYVVIGSFLIGASSSIVGCFTVLRKQALVGDVIAHSVLPGICMAFLLFDSKNPLVLLGGAFVTGWLSILFVDFITRNSRIKTDAAIGITLSAFFGAGMLLLTHIQHSGNAAQSGLDRFLFGKAAAIIGDDLILFAGMSIVLILVVLFFFKPFRLLIFDRTFAETIGLPVKFYEVILASITVLAVTVGIQAVGVVLMAALLITPAVAARYWTDDLRIMLFIAAFVGSVSSVAGAYVSYLAPSMPTGPWIIVVMMILGLLSIFFAPKRGVAIKRWRQRSNFKKILEENVLKLLYQLEEQDPREGEYHTQKDMLARREMGENYLVQSINRLIKQELIETENGRFRLTQEGRGIGKRMVRLHRLWEVYLTQVLKLPSDHVHETAEAMEHILTPELEAQLDKKLNHPEYDPHNSKIPY